MKKLFNAIGLMLIAQENRDKIHKHADLIDDNERSLDKLESEVSELREIIRNRDNRIAKEIDDNEALTIELKEMLKINSDLDEEVVDIETKLDHAYDTLEEKEEYIRELEAEINRKEYETNELDAEIYTLKEEISELNERLFDLEN